MECRAPLIYAQLISPGLDLDEVSRGQLLTLVTAISILVVFAMIFFLFSMIA